MAAAAIQLRRLGHVRELQADEVIVCMPVGVILRENGTRFVRVAMGREPVGRFGAEEDEDELEDSPEELYCDREAPRPRAGYVEGSVRCPARYDGAEEVEGIEESADDWSLSRMRKLETQC